ncbi:heme ABC transporter ATP-binding protein [uncultured Cyclobacterium sp.]|uniref:heme ABC transporter ATP-binding protein n=1 Tax=uncultured Cyclobacterium sp. TaxID=453820 RepID=UPI0030EBB529|tara:strand:- start:274630 stop:275430 length:801 start_codon:yes stop_codon:yes gene_type:complete
MLRASNIQFRTKNQTILDSTSLEVESGQITAVLGPNGAGKTTLFKLISGESPCSCGEVHYNGLNVAKFKARQLAEIRAVMPQHSSVNFPFTVREVVELGLISIQAHNPDKTIAEVMDLAQIEHLQAREYSLLSGGEKQRVQLSRVLVQVWERKPYPRYVLLDEPTSSLDIAQQHAVLDILCQLKNRNIGVLVILHDLNLAAQYADKILLLKSGKVCFCGPMKEGMDEFLLEKVFDYPIKCMHCEATNQLIIHSSNQSKMYSSSRTM